MNSAQGSAATPAAQDGAARPKLNPAFLLAPVADGYVAYDPARDQLHQLNPVAALLTELCDGRRSADEIRALGGPLMPGGNVGEIDRWLAQALDIELVIPAGAVAAARELTADELHDLARRLCLKGSVQTAYLCAKRAVELQPDAWETWYNLGEIAQCVGKRDEARQAYQNYLDANPEDAEIEHLLLALRDDAPPPRASDRTIQHIYKGFAKSYETRMLADLKYVGPQRIESVVQAVLGDRRGLSILDMGCGSGLAGMTIKPRARALTGIDLSPEMIALATARNIYDRLEVAELTTWLNAGTTSFDLAMSCDCLIYFGDLNEIIAAAARRIRPGAFIIFSVERGTQYPLRLTDTGRYAHHPDHLRDVARNAGLSVAHLDEDFLRMEYGEDVIGLFAAFQKPV